MGFFRYIRIEIKVGLVMRKMKGMKKKIEMRKKTPEMKKKQPFQMR